MHKQNTLKPDKISKLPSLHKEGKTSLLKQNQSFRPFLFEQRKLNQKYQEHPHQLEQVKAHNFINQTHVISSPSIICNLAERIKKQYSKKLETDLQFSEANMIKSNTQNQKVQKEAFYSRQKQNIFAKCMNSSHLSLNGSFYDPDKKYSFQRNQLINLSKWIDQKLQSFNKKRQINVNQIIEYKQHILNYGLGKIIDSVSKKCKQEGDLLKILIQHSFKIFEKVLQVVSTSVYQKQKQHLDEQKQTKQIFSMNLNFLKDQNTKINAQLNNIYQKMKKVIIWNKRLRKQKKTLNIMNRVLQYRNETYAQALQQTIDMFLKSVPQPATLNFSKKIISKLARQKRRKKKGFQRNQAQQDFKIQAKQYVNSWLRRNGFRQQDDQQIDPIKYLTNDQNIQLSKIDDQNKTKEINIFDYFKLLDIGVQATQSMHTVACQYDNQLKPKTAARGIITDTIFKKNFQIQTNMNEGVWFKQQQLVRKVYSGEKQNKILRRNEKKKSNVSRFSQKSEKLKERIQNKKLIKDTYQLSQLNQQKNQKFNKNAKKIKGKQVMKNYRKKQDGENSSIKYVKQNTLQSLQEEKDIRFYEKDFTIISQKKSEEFNFDSQEQIKNSPSQKYRVSLSKLNGEESRFNRFDFSKLQNEQNGMGRQISIRQFTEIAGYDEAQLQALGQNNLKNIWKFMQIKKNKDPEKGQSRLSMNFIKYDNSSYSMKKLEKKFFNQVYQEGKINSISKQKQRQNLFEAVVRRRSFYKKGRVMFENSSDVQQSKESKSNLYKGYLHYRTHRNRTIIQLTEEDEQRLDQINKKIPIPSNLAKSKALAASKQIFKQISQVCKKTKKQPPKNKQYFNSSIVSICKNVGALVYEYIKQIKRQKDDIQNDCQKIYYPLHTILMDKMNWKYGLKDISQKKIKDFIQKILTFAPASEKISLYSLLFGMQNDGVGADELLVYLKCLVFLQKKQSIGSSIHIVKQTNFIERANTDADIVEQNIDKILKQFFDLQGKEIVRNQVSIYLQQNPKYVSIQKIADIIIRCLLKRKEMFKKDCMDLYKLMMKGNNVFSNLYKILKIFNNYEKFQYQKNQINKMQYNMTKKYFIDISRTLKQFIKRSDTIDEIYGKSISFDRFLTAYMVTEIPKFQNFTKKFQIIIQIFSQKYQQALQLKNIKGNSFKDNLVEFNPDNAKLLQQIQRKWQIKNCDKIQEQNWQWNVTKTVCDHVENSVKSVLGKLGIINNQIQNYLFSLQKNIIQ